MVCVPLFRLRLLLSAAHFPLPAVYFRSSVPRRLLFRVATPSVYSFTPEFSRSTPLVSVGRLAVNVLTPSSSCFAPSLTCATPSVYDFSPSVSSSDPLFESQVLSARTFRLSVIFLITIRCIVHTVFDLFCPVGCFLHTVSGGSDLIQKCFRIGSCVTSSRMLVFNLAQSRFITWKQPNGLFPDSSHNSGSVSG